MRDGNRTISASPLARANMVLRLPMRDGNLDRAHVRMSSSAVLRLPMRDGNSILRKRLGAEFEFLDYL